MATDPANVGFLARMRALARKGGAVTKRLYANDPRYYRDIGRLGGAASVAARKAKIVAELEHGPSEAPIINPTATPIEARRVAAQHLVTLADILADIERAGPCVQEPTKRQRLEDEMAEENFARFLPRILHENADDDPWDP
jgi:hypothetical protein